jgi:hypothetical protein
MRFKDAEMGRCNWIYLASVGSALRAREQVRALKSRMMRLFCKQEWGNEEGRQKKIMVAVTWRATRRSTNGLSDRCKSPLIQEIFKKGAEWSLRVFDLNF